MANEKKAPEIRFDGFCDEWLKKTINDYGYFYYGKSAPKWSVKPNAPTPCVRYGELYTKFDGLVDKVYSYTTIPHEKLKFSTGKEVLVPRVGEEPLDFARCSWLSLSNIAIGEMISVYNTEQNPLFVALYFNAMMRNAFADKVEGGNVSNLYYNRLLDLEVSFPSILEQKHIAEFFRSLDNAIALKKQHCEQTLNIKKAMLEKMFPKVGADVPEIRFEGFTEAWEVCMLGNAFSHTMEYVNPLSENLELWSLTIENGLTPKTERYVRDFLVKKNDRYKAVRPNDVIYNPMNMTLGAIGYNDMSISVAVSGYYVTMKPADHFDGYFIKTWMQLPSSIELYKTHATGSLREKQRVQYTTFELIPFIAPKKAEQVAIGNFFRSLDTLINAQREELEKLQNIKKACLSKMFV